jgi:hypothetical protein
MPNTNLADIDDDPNRSYRKIRLYMDELIAHSTQVHDIDSFSPVASIYSDEDDLDILSVNESIVHNYSTDPTVLTESNEFDESTSTSDKLEITSNDENEISQLLESIIEQIEQRMTLEEQQ